MKNFFILQLLLAMFLFCTLGLAQGTGLKINEFMASNDFAVLDPQGDYEDWIEIYNSGSESVDIGGMYITDDLSKPTLWQIPASQPDLTTILPGHFLVLWADKEPAEGVLHVNIKLSGSGEAIGLYASDGSTVIDTLVFQAQITDTSYGQYPDASGQWMNFDNPTPGFTNRPVPLIVNEFLASNNTGATDPQGEFEDWIEIFNAGVKPIDLGGMYMTDNLATPSLWQIPTTDPVTTTIQPGSFLVLWADKEPADGLTHVNFKLSGDGEAIGIFGSDGATVIDTLGYTAQQSDTSLGRRFDGQNDWVNFSVPSVGMPNVQGIITAIDPGREAGLRSFKLNQNYPNPFNPQTTIHFELLMAGTVTIDLYNSLGQKVATLLNASKPAGNHKISYDASHLTSGVYYYRLSSGSRSEVKKMVVMK